MQAGDVVLLLVLLALAAAVGLAVARLRTALRAAQAESGRLDRLAVARGRSLSLAAQELRGIASGMGACGSVSGGSLCGGPGVLAEGPAQKLFRLADDLAEVAAGSERRTIHEAPAPLGPIVDGAIGVIERQIRPGRRHWQVDPALRRLTVKADGRALEGALAALLRRAASHSRDGDAIVLRWVVASETVAIVVEDEGDGLPAPDLVPDATAPLPGTRGLDLGLSLARSLAAAHGGDIRLETAPGIGARAWLTLPRARLLEAA
jgi:signal transduction histidine kinase